MLNKIKELIEKKTINKNTPYFLIDKGRIVYNFLFFKHKLNLEEEDIFYSVKANNNSEVIKELTILGSGFEIASIHELQILVNQDVDTNKVIFSNPVKIPSHISGSYKMGINKFAFDTENELYKISKFAPKSKVLLRLEVDNNGAEWTLDKKFGAKIQNTVDLFKLAIRLNLEPFAISIHNGWNNVNINTWKNNIEIAKQLIINCRKEAININILNLGGGFPAHNIDQFKFLEDLSANLTDVFKEMRENHNIKIITEPGSFIVNYAGILVTRIFDIVTRDTSKWIFIDTGIIQGFPWVLSNLKYEFLYPYQTDENCKKTEFIITGPTNDSKDIFGKYSFPENIKINDYLCIYPAGAYTTSSLDYNGFKIPELNFL